MRSLALVALAVALVVGAAQAVLGQAAFPRHWTTTASSNSTLVFTGRALVNAVVLSNPNGSTGYIKLYDKATPPTCGTDAPVWSIMAASVSPHDFIVNLLFNNGVGFCFTGASGDSDSSNGPAGVTIDLGVSGR